MFFVYRMKLLRADNSQVRLSDSALQKKTDSRVMSSIWVSQATRARVHIGDENKVCAHAHAHTLTAATGNSCEENWKASSTVHETKNRKGAAFLYGRTCEDQRLIKRKRDKRKEKTRNSICNPWCVLGHVLFGFITHNQMTVTFLSFLCNMFGMLYICMHNG